MTTKDSKIIRLTRIKQWYIPADTETYLVLRSLGMPLTKIHADFLETLKLVTGPAKVRAVGVDFANEILNPWLDKLGAAWKKGANRDCTLTNKELRFETTKRSALNKAKASVPKLEACIRRFMSRWGYACTFSVDELRGKLRFVVQYRYNSEAQPIIPLEKDAAEIPEFKIAFGRVRLVLRLNEVNASSVSYALKNGQQRPYDHKAETQAALQAEAALAAALAEAERIEDETERNAAIKQANKTFKMSKTEASGADRLIVARAPEVEVRFEVRQGDQWALANLSHCLYSEISSVVPMLRAMAHIVNADPSNMEA